MVCKICNGFSFFNLHHITETPKRSSSKIIMITAFCTAYLLHASYSALVFGQIAGQTSRLPFSDLETLAIDGSYKLTVRKGGAYEERINEKKSLKKLLVKDLPDSEQAALRQVRAYIVGNSQLSS